MAAPARQHTNGFIRTARLIGSFLADELRELAGRSATFASTGRGINHIEEAQVAGGATIGNPRIAHNRGRFERTIDLSYAPFGDVTRYPPSPTSPVPDLTPADLWSIPRNTFIAGSLRFRLAGRIERATLSFTNTVGIRAGLNNDPDDGGIPVDNDVGDWPDVEVAVDLRLVRSGVTLLTEPMDDAGLLEEYFRDIPLRTPGDPVNFGHPVTGTFKTPATTFIKGLPVIAGPIRLSTKVDETADALGKPGAINELPLLISDFGAGDMVVAVVSTPRAIQIFLGNGSGSWSGTKWVIENPVTGATVYRTFEATSIGPAHIAFDLSYEAQP